MLTVRFKESGAPGGVTVTGTSDSKARASILLSRLVDTSLQRGPCWILGCLLPLLLPLQASVSIETKSRMKKRHTGSA